jgi:fatty-acyl-CoA synthase
MERADVPTLPGLLERAAAQFPTAGVAFEDGRQTYAELLASATEYARRLRTLGIGQGDKVGIFAGDRPEYLWALYGATLLGAVAVPVNGRFKVRELRHAITNAEIKVLFCGGGFANHAGLVAEALEGIEGPEVVAWDPDPPQAFRTDFDAIEPTDFDPAALTLEDPGMILYTSGTTAMPKGCVLSQEALVRPAYAMRDRFALTDEDRMWDALPLFHLASLLPLHACMLAGASYVAMRRFDPAEALAQMERERCTTAFPAFETVWLAILNHPNFASTDLSSMRLVLNVGTRERLEQMQATMHWATQISSYGCTELGGVCAFGHIEDPLELRVTTSGRPFPGMEIRIIDPETGAQKPVGETGEIICRGHSMFSGYYREPELTAAVIDDEGFFHTGDLGALDADGRVQYRGRLKDMLKVGGENVGAAEIEGHLATHPAVEIVQVVGVRDARYTEVPVAFVQLRAGATATEDELIGHCHGEIATYKVPRYVRFTNEWPMSGTKIQKFRLREQITAELDAAGIAEAPKFTTPASARTVLQPR